MKYCDDMNCPNFDALECKLGFIIRFRTPKTIADAIYHNWGYVMSKACQRKFFPPRRCSQEVMNLF